MSFHTLYFSKPGKLSIKNKQLLIAQDDKVAIPLEDIATVVIESGQIVITSSALAQMAEHGIEVLVCGSDHKPVGVQLPFLPFSRQAKINRYQVRWSDSFKKRCHQRIIQYKIKNQALCFEYLSGSKHLLLLELAKGVKLGDKTQHEAHAAAVYFNWLLQGHGRRDDSYLHNQFLNYAYAILRSRIAQALSATGFIPSLGLFHRNDLNHFNLADDIIEPFRPFADFYIATYLKDYEFLGTQEKSIILEMLEIDIVSEEGTNKGLSLSQHIEKSVQSLKRACLEDDSQLLDFPFLASLKERIYE